MDNDNALLEAARNLYKGWRFGWKYRGVRVLDAEAGNDLARAAIEKGGPYLFARCGATEMRTVADKLAHGGHFTDRTRQDIRNLSGVFPTDDETLNRFCELYVSCAQSADLLALWDVGAEREVIRGCRNTAFCKLRALEPYYHPHPLEQRSGGQKGAGWCILQKHHPAPVRKAGQAFPRHRRAAGIFRPDGHPGRAGLAGQDTGYASWFDALTAMEEKMDAADYEVAIVGAGAYGLPLAAHARDTGHTAIQMSGATQLLFGIKGKRWDTHPVISKLYNDAWVRPAEDKGIDHREAVEGGSYW